RWEAVGESGGGEEVGGERAGAVRRGGAPRAGGAARGRQPQRRAGRARGGPVALQQTARLAGAGAATEDVNGGGHRCPLGDRVIGHRVPISLSFAAGTISVCGRGPGPGKGERYATADRRGPEPPR